MAQEKSSTGRCMQSRCQIEQAKVLYMQSSSCFRPCQRLPRLQPRLVRGASSGLHDNRGLCLEFVEALEGSALCRRWKCVACDRCAALLYMSTICQGLADVSHGEVKTEGDSFWSGKLAGKVSEVMLEATHPTGSPLRIVTLHCDGVSLWTLDLVLHARWVVSACLAGASMEL